MGEPLTCITNCGTLRTTASSKDVRAYGLLEMHIVSFIVMYYYCLYVCACCLQSFNVVTLVLVMAVILPVKFC